MIQAGEEKDMVQLVKNNERMAKPSSLTNIYHAAGVSNAADVSVKLYPR
jgi:hypothetical protein